MDIKSLLDFYATPLGELVHLYVQDTVDQFLNIKQGSILGLGFATPYLKESLFETNQVMAFMPEYIGGITWPTPAASRTAVVKEDSLPLPNKSVDRILLIHGVEFAKNAQRMIGELSRILKSDGKILIIAPNKRGIWSHFENTPFGFGHSFSMSQLSQILSNEGFKCLIKERFLYFPPSQSLYTQSFFAPMEMIGSYLIPKLSGLNAIIADKRTFAIIPKKPVVAMSFDRNLSPEKD